MRDILESKLEKISDNSEMNSYYINSVADNIIPNKVGISKTYCDPDFFNPKEHMKNIKHMRLSDKMYIQHMIPHHQVAIDMSKILIKIQIMIL